MALIDYTLTQPSQLAKIRMLKAVFGLWPSRTVTRKEDRIEIDPRALQDCGLRGHCVEDAYYRHFAERGLR